MNHKVSDRHDAVEQHFTPFDNAEEAWFWFVAAQEALNDGARFSAGTALYARPCEPIDILKILDRLYRNRQLKRDHFLVLRHYGRRHMPPDARRVKEKRSYDLWREAFDKITPILEKKGIVRAQSWVAQYYPDHALGHVEDVCHGYQS